MLDINRNYIIIFDLKTSKIDFDTPMIFRNTDVGIANMYIKLNYKDIADIFEGISSKSTTNIAIELAIVKPKSYEFIPLLADLISEENLLYEVKLPSKCTDLIGEYNCELRVYATVDDKEEKVTSEPFTYVVKPSIATKLNEQIQVSSDLPILENLIKQVKELSLNIENNSVQMKIDNNLVGDNKTIVGTINQLLLKTKNLSSSGGSGGTVNPTDILDDDNILTEKTWSSNKIQNELITLKDDVTYVPININNFKTSLSKTIYELGVDTLTSVPLTWSLSKTPKTISITDCSNVSPSISFTTYIGNIKDTKTFTLTVTDEKGNVKTANTTIHFVYPFYYGTYSDVLTSQDILSQNKLLQIKSNKTVVMSYEDKKVFFTYPKSYGNLKDIVDGSGFSYINDFTLSEISIKNVAYNLYSLEEKASVTDITYTFMF